MDDTTKPRTMLDVREAARYLGFGARVKVVYRLIESGSLACVRESAKVCTRTRRGRVEQYRKPGRVWILEADCDAWITRHRSPATAEATTIPVKGYRTSLELTPLVDRRFS